MGCGSKPVVFALHNWETGDGYHRVSVGSTIRRFRKWSKAEAFAKKRAKKLGLDSYIVDTPKRAHVKIKLLKKRKKI